jgi:LPXTG-motif cell wall-anchored protein
MKSALVLLFLLVVSISSNAQETATAAENVEKLKAQLIDVQAKEEALRERAQQLDEAIKPENIERSLAGIGSTKPEELRESRRKQLTIERDGVLAQLRTAETSRQRLEAAIANAEILAYQQSARPAQMTLRTSSRKGYQLLILGGGVAALALGGGAFLYRRKRNRR